MQLPCFRRRPPPSPSLFPAGEIDEQLVVQKQDILSGHMAPILRVRFSSEGNLLASGSSDGIVRYGLAIAGTRF